MSISVLVGKLNGSISDGSSVIWFFLLGGSESGSRGGGIDGAGGGGRWMDVGVVVVAEMGIAGIESVPLGLVVVVGVAVPDGLGVSAGAGVSGRRINVSCPFCSWTKNFMCAFSKPFSPTSDL